IFTPANGVCAAPTHDVGPGASASRDPALERRARLTARLAKLAAAGHLAPLARQVGGLGGCARPIRLTGHRTRVDSVTGLVLDHLDARHLPAGELLVRCGDRRVTRCPALLHRLPLRHLPAHRRRTARRQDRPDRRRRPSPRVRHPHRLGFGPVHNQPDGTGRCRCGDRHADNDPLLGSPLHPERYDYTGAVLWNAHAPALWARFTTHLRREIAWEDYTSWRRTDRKMLARINKLIKDVLRDPFNGIGKPEPLKYRLPGAWSRRIDDEHHLVYL